jgi:hypothetical protein
MGQREDETTLTRMGATSQRYQLSDATRSIPDTGNSVVTQASGIAVTVPDGRGTKTLHMDVELWAWLRPLLEELHTRRR